MSAESTDTARILLGLPETIKGLRKDVDALLGRLGELENEIAHLMQDLGGPGEA